MLDSRLIGVAHMGSRTGFDFSEDDKLLFRALASRATVLIYEDMLQQRAETRAAEELRRLQDILAKMPTAIAIVDPDRRIVMSNEEMVRLWGDAPAPGVRTSDRIERYRRADGSPLPVDELPSLRALAGETVTAEELRQTRPDGSERTLLVNAVPLRDFEGRITAAVTAAADITERKHYEEQLRRQADFRERFIGIVGHDLRNPLNAILMSALMLIRREDDLGAEVAHGLVRIKASARRMDRMIRDLLDFTRGRLGGGIPIEPKPIDALAACREVIDELDSAHPGRTIHLDAQGDCRGEMDRDRISQVVSNLVGNALAHGDPAGSISVRLRPVDDFVVLEVSNQGTPIAPEILPHVFDPFRRALPAGDTRSQGLGLGLYIVKEIVEAHGGTVAARSDEHETTFTVRLPRRPPPPRHAPLSTPNR